MYCRNCGAEIRDDSMFCPYCGAQVVHPDDMTEAPTSAVEGAGPAPATNPKGHRKLALGICIAVVAVVVLLVVTPLGDMLAGLFGGSSDNTVSVPLSIVAPGYDDSTDSPIPVRISGQTEAGDDYEETFYVTTAKPEVDVPAGDYQVEVVASPLTKSGTFYSIPEPVQLSVSTDSQDSGDGSSSGSDADAGSSESTPAATIELTAKPASEVTQEEIDASVAAAKDAGFDADEADEMATMLWENASKSKFAPVIEDYLENKLLNVDYNTASGDTSFGDPPSAFFSGNFVTVGSQTLLLIGHDQDSAVPLGIKDDEIYQIVDGEPKLILSYNSAHSEFYFSSDGTMCLTTMPEENTTVYSFDDSGSLVVVEESSGDLDAVHEKHPQMDVERVSIFDLAEQTGVDVNSILAACDGEFEVELGSGTTVTVEGDVVRIEGTMRYYANDGDFITYVCNLDGTFELPVDDSTEFVSAIGNGAYGPASGKEEVTALFTNEHATFLILYVDGSGVVSEVQLVLDEEP